MSRFGGRVTRNLCQVHDQNCYPNSKGYCECPLELAPEDVAELVCSDLGDGMHKPVIDLDLGAELVPSGTPGHFHLYLNHAVPLDKYLAVLDAMADAGLVQWGYADATRERGFGSLRHPDRPKLAGVPHDGE